MFLDGLVCCIAIFFDAVAIWYIKNQDDDPILKDITNCCRFGCVWGARIVRFLENLELSDRYILY